MNVTMMKTTGSQELVAKEKLEPRDFVSWAAYRASKS